MVARLCIGPLSCLSVEDISYMYCRELEEYQRLQWAVSADSVEQRDSLLPTVCVLLQKLEEL